MEEVDKLRLIEAVRQRPILWDCRIQRINSICDSLWAEIGEILNTDVTTCRHIWKRLRMQFCNEGNRIQTRIQKAKEKGEYMPKAKYYTWCYFDPLRFLLSGLSCQAQFHLNFGNEPDVGMVKQNNTSQIQVPMEDEFIYCSFENDSDIEKSNNSDLISETENQLKIYYENNDDIELIENNISGQKQFQKESCLQNSSLTDFNTDNGFFNSYTISLCEITSENGCTTISNENNDVHKDDTNLRNQHNSESPDTNDLDYNFLYSFLTQIKLMNGVQKINFQEKMQTLLLNIFPTTYSTSILEKKLLLSECEDPDKKLLISFWPIVKSMSVSQNLRFRLKMTDLVFKILFAVTNE